MEYGDSLSCTSISEHILAICSSPSRTCSILCDCCWQPARYKLGVRASWESVCLSPRESPRLRFNHLVLHELGMAVYPYNPTLRGQKQEDLELKAILRHILWSPAWAQWDPISKNGRGQKKRKKEKRNKDRVLKYALILPDPYVPRYTDTPGLLSMPQDLCTFWHVHSSRTYLGSRIASTWLHTLDGIPFSDSQDIFSQ